MDDFFNDPVKVGALIAAVMVLIDQIVAATPTEKDNKVWGVLSNLIRFFLIPSRDKNGGTHTKVGLFKGLFAKKDKSGEK